MTKILRLRTYRENRKLSLRDLAKELGVDHSTLSYWETGKKAPRAGNKMKIANYFGVSADYLLQPDTEDKSTQ